MPAKQVVSASKQWDIRKSTRLSHLPTVIVDHSTGLMLFCIDFSTQHGIGGATSHAGPTATIDATRAAQTPPLPPKTVCSHLHYV